MVDVVIRPVTAPVSIVMGENTAEAARQAGRAREAADRAVQIVGTADEIVAAATSIDGRTITIAGGQMVRLGENAPVAFAGSVTLDAPATFNVAEAALQLTYVNGRVGWPFCPAKLAGGNVTGLVVKDAGSGAVLIAGSDYVADLRFGALALAANGAARAVTVSYTWSQERYDLIYVDPEFQSVGVVKGEAANRDAAERLPTTGTKNGATLIDMRMPLFHARVTASGVELVKVWNIRGGIAREFEAQLAADRRRNRDAIRPFLAALERGAATTWSAMGDSITALQSQQPDRLAPNGPYRDRATARDLPNTYLREGIIASAPIDAIPVYDAGDGQGAVHTRFGRTWALIAAATQRYAGAITYKNYSIAGTNADDSNLGMTNPERLAAWAQDGSDLGIIATGMNDSDVGATLLFNRVRQMIDAAYAGGKKGVIVWGCSRPQASAMDTATWLRINRVLRRAAETPGVGGRTAAFIDLGMVEYGAGVGTLGLVPSDLCLANGYNHPGLRQHEIEGELGRKLIFGQA